MWYRTKGEVAEYYGKSKTDVRFVDRRILKGEVKIKDGGYEVYDLKTEYEKIQKELDMYKQCYEDNVVRYNELLDRYNELKASSSQERIQEKGDDYEEMKANCEYYRKKFQRCKRGYELVIELTYKYAAKNMKIEKSEYKEQLAEEVNNLLDEQYGRD